MKTAEAKTTSESSHSWNPVLQNGPFFSSGECERSSFFETDTIQPKLKIGAPDDKYEKQADRVADRVVEMPDSGPGVQMQGVEEEEMLQTQPMEEEEPIQMQEEEEVQAKLEHNLQTKCEACAEEESLQMKEINSSNPTDQIGPRLDSKKGSGSHMSNSVQNELSNKMGADFSNVNIHTDSEAVQMNQSLGARAFTHGSNIFFNRGEYSPSSSRGKHLLVHELTHVVQQGGDKKKKIVQRQSEEGEEKKASNIKVDVVTKGDFSKGETETSTKQTAKENINETFSAEASVKTGAKDTTGAFNVKAKDKSTGLSASAGVEQKQPLDTSLPSKDTYSLTVGGKRKFFDKQLILSSMFTTEFGPLKKPIYSLDTKAVLFPEGTLTPSVAFEFLSDPKEGKTYSLDAGLEYRITKSLSAKAGVGMDIKDDAIIPRVSGGIVITLPGI